MNDQEPPKKRWSYVQWAVVGVVVLLGVLLVSSQFTYVSYQAPQMKAFSNAKQVLIALRHCASQCGGFYPVGLEQGTVPPPAELEPHVSGDVCGKVLGG